MLQEPATHLVEAEELLPLIGQLYESSLTEQLVHAELPVRVKSYVELLQAALNACAVSVYRLYCSSAESPDPDAYPVFDDAAKFLTHMRIAYPELTQRHPALFRQFMTDQPFVLPSSWLKALDFLQKDTHYANYTPLMGTTSRSISLMTFHGEEIEFPDISTDRAAGPYSKAPQPAWTGLAFSHNGKDVLLTLGELADGVRKIIDGFAEASQ